MPSGRWAERADAVHRVIHSDRAQLTARGRRQVGAIARAARAGLCALKQALEHGSLASIRVWRLTRVVARARLSERVAADGSEWPARLSTRAVAALVKRIWRSRGLGSAVVVDGCVARRPRVAQSGFHWHRASSSLRISVASRRDPDRIGDRIGDRASGRDRGLGIGDRLGVTPSALPCPAGRGHPSRLIHHPWADRGPVMGWVMASVFGVFLSFRP